MEILRIEGLSKIFGSGRLEVRALEDINLSVSAGRFGGPAGTQRFRQDHYAAMHQLDSRPHHRQNRL